MAQVAVYKVNAIPSVWAVNAVYWVKISSVVKCYITDNAGVPYQVKSDANTFQEITDAGNATTDNVELTNSNLLFRMNAGDNTNYHILHPVTLWRNNSATTGYLAIIHPMLTGTFQSTMFDMTLKIYSYNSPAVTGSIAEIRLIFYCNSTTTIVTSNGLSAYITGTNTGLVNALATNGAIQVGFNSNGDLAIILGTASTSWGSYNRVEVENITTSFQGGDNAQWQKGWVAAVPGTSLTGYTGLVTVPVSTINVSNGSAGSSPSNQETGLNLNSLPNGNYVTWLSSTGATNIPSGMTLGGSLYRNYINTGSGFATDLFLSGNADDNVFVRRTTNSVTASSWYQLASRNWVASQAYLTAETDPVYTAAIPNISMYKGLIPNSADLNTYLTTGIWGASSSTTVSNRPSGSTFNFILQVYVASGGTYISQAYFGYNGTQYLRYSQNSGSTFTPWAQVQTSLPTFQQVSDTGSSTNTAIFFPFQGNAWYKDNAGAERLYLGTTANTNGIIFKNSQTTHNFQFRNPTNGIIASIANDGTILSAALSGTGTRMVVTDASGNLGSQAIPNNTYTGSTSITLSGNTFKRAALSGDVIADYDDNTTKIVPNAVGNSQLADMPANTIKGRLSSTGDPQDLTAAQVRSILSTPDVRTGTATIVGDGTTNNFSITFSTAFPSGTVPVVLLTAFSSGCASRQVYLTGAGNSDFQVSYANVPFAGQNVSFKYAAFLI